MAFHFLIQKLESCLRLSSRLGCVLALFAVTGLAQTPTQYQVIKVRFQILSRGGEPLPKATLAARLDSSSSRKPSDKTIGAGQEQGEYAYSADNPEYTIFSSEQISGEDGLLEVPFVVYKDKPDPIDYELSCLYGKERSNRLLVKNQKQAISSADGGTLITLTIDALAPLPVSRLLIVILVWVGASIMGALLFFRGVYRALLSEGKPIDLSRALCWSGVLLISLTAMALLYWLLLPKVVNLYIFMAFLFAVWLLHLIFTVLPKRA